LVPDTSLNEVAIMTDKCKNCTGINPLWTAPNNTGGAKNVTGTIDQI
jgi:hypothetical protein